MQRYSDFSPSRRPRRAEERNRWPRDHRDDYERERYRSRSRDQRDCPYQSSRPYGRQRDCASVPPAMTRNAQRPSYDRSPRANFSRPRDYRRLNSPPRTAFRPPPLVESPYLGRSDDQKIPQAHPALMKTVQTHRNMQERRPVVGGVLPSIRDAEVTEAKLRLKAFLLKLAVDIDTFFLDHHNQISCEGDIVMCRTQEPVNATQMVAIYHFVVHIEERRNRVHALDVLQYGTKDCPYALRMCYQKDH